MNYKVKRLFAGLLAILIAFTSSGIDQYVIAASASADLSFYYASAKDIGEISELKTGYYHEKILYAMIENEAAYCMNYGLTAHNGQLMNSFDNAKTSLSDMQYVQLEYCMYYGYGATSNGEPSNDSKNKYIATQAMVWIIEANLFDKSSANSVALKLCNSAPNADQSYEYYKNLKAKMTKSIEAQIPSFTATSPVLADTIELEWNEANHRFEKTITDTNKVLSNYDISITGIKYSMDGNNITFYSKDVISSAKKVTFKSNDDTVKIKDNCVFWLVDDNASSHQEFVSHVPSADPIPAYLNIKTESVGYGALYKKDSASGGLLSGAVFGIYSDRSCTKLVEKLTTNSKGYAKSSALALGTYYVKEVEAPKQYVISTAVHTLKIKAGQTTTVNVSDNDSVTAKIKLNKVDKETGRKTPQGDASLAGAVYGLYAREAIVHPDGTTGTIYKKGALVATMTINQKGEAEVKNLYLGKYYVKEITPPEGYLVDEEEHDVICDDEGDLVAEVSRSVTSKEQVYKQPFQVIKVSDNGTDTEADLLEGAGFSAYLKSSLSVKQDGSYDFDQATPIVIGENGETTLYTDSKGYLVTIPIPYGTYVVAETVTPHNMKTITPFEVTINEHKPTQPQTWRVFLDREFTAKLKIVKKDSKTGQSVLVPRAEFKIFDMDKEEYVVQYSTYPSKVKHTSFFTDEDGKLVLPENLKIGTYRIEEVAAPVGYVVNEDYVFISVDSNTVYEVDEDTQDAIITVE